MAMTAEEYIRKRDIAVASLDLEVFKAFLEETKKDFYIPWMPSDTILEISMHKMACEITTLPMELRLKAAEWLMSRGYKPGIFYNDKEFNYETDGERKVDN